VSLHENDTILTLLPDTDHQGAQVVCEKIVRLTERNSSPLSDTSQIDFGDLEIQILSYPEKSWEDAPAGKVEGRENGESRGTRKNELSSLNANGAPLEAISKTSIYA
jgi:hypothetical protein